MPPASFSVWDMANDSPSPFPHNILSYHLTREQIHARFHQRSHPQRLIQFMYVQLVTPMPRITHDARAEEAAHSDHIRQRRKDDQRLPALLAMSEPQQRAANGHARQRAEAARHQRGRVEAAVVARIAKLTNTNRIQPEVAAAGEAERDNKNDQQGVRVARRQPEGQDRDGAQRVRDDDDVEAADAVGEQARQAAAEEGADVQERQQRVGGVGVLAVGGRVADDESQRDEKSPLHEPDACAAQAELEVAEQRPVRHDRGAAGARRQARAHEQVGDDGQEEQDEADDARAPREPDPGQHGLQVKGEHDAADGAGSGGDARGEAAARAEKMRDDAVGRDVKQGAAEAAEDGVAQHDLVVFCV
ncbi:Uu.00g049310.m01.CDS01, partial [Anthostomella pinea]